LKIINFLDLWIYKTEPFKELLFFEVNMKMVCQRLKN